MIDAPRLFLANGVVRKAVMSGGWLPLSVRIVVDLDFSAFQLLLMGTTMELAILLGEIPTGVVADVFSRKWSVVIGAVLISGAQFASGVVDEWAFYLFTQAVWGIGWTFISGAEIAWLTDELGSAERAEPLLLRRGQLEFVAVIVGIIVFGLLSWLVPLATAVMIAGGIGLGWSGVLAFAMTEHGFASRRRVHAADFAATLGDGARFTWRHRGLRTLGIAMLALGIAAEALDRLDLRRLEDLGLSSDMSPILVFGAVMIGKALLGAFVLARYTRRFSGRHVVTGFSTLMAAVAIMVVLLAHVPVLEFAVIALIVQGGLLNLAEPLTGIWANALAPDSARATVHSFIGQTRSLGEVGGGIVLGPTVAFTSLPIVWTIAAGLFLLSAAILASARTHWAHSLTPDNLG